MKHLTSKNIFLSLLAIALLVVFSRFLSLLSFPDSSVVLDKGELVPFAQKTALTQTFIANRNNLEKIQFLFRTPGPKAGDVSVEIMDESCSKTVRKGNLSIPFLNSNNLYEFVFDKIPDSKGKKYCLNIKTSVKGLRLFSMPATDSQFGLKNTTTGENFEGKTLSIRGAYVNDNLGQDLSELSQRISQYKPWFLKNYFIDTIAVLFVIGSIGLFILLA